VEIEQPAGRILRKYHKDINPMIIDIVDNTGNFPNHSRERNKWFAEEDYIIHDHTVELINDTELWKAPVADYLHKMKMETVRRRKAKIEKEREEAEVGPDLTKCVLNDEDGNVPVVDIPIQVKSKSKLKIKGEVKVQAKIQGEAPNNKLCYLAYAAPKQETPLLNLDTSICLI
jgi:hypothetical protein